MKLLLLLLLPFMAFSQGWASPAEAARGAALQQALQQASAPAAVFYNDGYQNDTEKLLYHQVFNFLDAFAPAGRKSVFNLTHTDVPNTDIVVYTAPYAKLCAQLRAAGKDPQSVLPSGSNGVTLVAVDRKTGHKNLLIFIASDLVLGKEKIAFPMSQAKQYEFVAKLAAIMAHEIYGHAYMSIYDTRQNIPRREQELYAYKQSAEFLARVAAHPQVRAVPGLVQALQDAQEEENYRHFVWGQKKN